MSSAVGVNLLPTPQTGVASSGSSQEPSSDRSSFVGGLEDANGHRHHIGKNSVEEENDHHSHDLDDDGENFNDNGTQEGSTGCNRDISLSLL